MRQIVMHGTLHSPLRRLRAALLGLCLGLALATSLAGVSPAQAQTKFPTAEDAAAALAKAAGAHDTATLRAILGPQSERLVSSGDPVEDRTSGDRFAQAYAARHSLAPGPNGTMVLSVGTNDWPLPIPLVQAAGGWHFDISTTENELVDRRIGRNELSTIRTLLAGVLAQKDYFDRAQRGAGAGFYAQRILSTPGKLDGLYWETDADEAPSPLTPLVRQAMDEGYPGAIAPNGQPVPYHGYFFRVLKAQGPQAPGGAKEYVRKGLMTEGFAFLAWPARYDTSGVVSFLVGPDGNVYQKDLGPNTAKLAAAITRFDPDLTWVPVKLAD